MKTPSVKNLALSLIASAIGVGASGTAWGAVLDDFNDNTKTGWQDFTFVAGVGLPLEQDGQFVFSLPPAGQALFSGSRKNSEEYELKAGRTIELKVDLIEGNGKDSFAVLGFIPTANSLGTLDGYGFAKSTTDILLTKGIGKYFLAEDPGTPIKNDNVTLVLRLAATADTVTITGQVLDKDDGNAVIWERTVVDTAAADVLAAGSDSPAAPYLTKGHFSLYCYEDFDAGAPQAEYRVVYDNAVICLLDDTVLDNFDDNTKTDWADFTFVAGLGLPVEENGQFTFNLPPAGQALFTASRKTSRVLDLTECGRLQLRVDMIHGEGKDSFAVLGFIPEANSLGTLAGYGLAKSSTDVLLTKGIGKYFYNEGLSLKNDNITLVLDLSVSNAVDVHITGRILDKDDNDAVIWERTVVDTQAADVMADGSDAPAAPYLTTGHFSLFCYEDFDAGAPFPLYQVIYDNAATLAPAVTANTPPIISDVQPGETDNFRPANTEIRFKVQDDKPLVNGQISITLNGTVHTTANGLVVTGSGNSRDVSLGGLSANVDYTAVLRVVDSDNAPTASTLHFDTFEGGNLVAEIEDYNFGGGAFIDNPIPVAEGNQDGASYSMTQGTPEVDFHETRTAPNGTNTRYRPGDAIRMQHTFDVLRQKFSDAGGNEAGVWDYDVGDIVAGEWMQYTRTFPAGSYHVYLREALVNMSGAESLLEEVTGDRSQPDAATRQLGTFLGALSGFQYRNVPLTDATGQKTILRLSGEHTLRVRQMTTPPGDGAISQNYLIFVPTADPGIQRATVTSVSPAANSTVSSVRLNLSATIQNRDTSVQANTIELKLNGSTLVSTITPQDNGAVVTAGPLPLPPSGSLNTASVTFKDNLNVSQTTEWTFTLVYSALNPANGIPGSGLESGFMVRMAQGDPSVVPHENSIAQAEDILAGRYALVMDTNTTALVVNQNKAQGSGGYFPDDELVPGLYDETLTPFPFGNSDFAVENVAWLELAPGAYRFGGRTDDGFKCSSGSSLHDLSAGAILGFHNGGPADSAEESEFEFVVTQAGLYPFRFMWYERGGAAIGEFYSVDLSTGDRILINDPTAPNAIRAFRTLPRLPIVIVTTTDNGSTPDDGQTSFLEALQTAQAGDTIRFNIAGAGPHVIVTPMGGYPFITTDNLTIDGYSQSGASPNTNPILGGNNAVLKIVLDSSDPTAEPSSVPEYPNIHRSTRLIFPGFGDTEDAILPVVGAKNVNIRGLSFKSRYARDESDDPNVYCVAFVNQNPATLEESGATGGHVNGCWFGLAPDGHTLQGGRASVATFLNNGVGASGLVIGTDGDGANDRAEFNIHAAMSLAIHLQVSDVKVSGNYVNVLPNGNSFVDVNEVALAIGQVADPENPEPQSVEFLENANCTGMTIGTDGDGVADADERNIVANVSYSETMEFWRAADLVVVAGNYFGVGVDGVTESPVSRFENPDFVRLSRVPSNIRIGSNGDGVSDDLEGNLIVNVRGDRFVAPAAGAAGDIAEIGVRRNTMKNCGFAGIPFGDGVPDTGATYLNYYVDVLADSSSPKPALTSFVNGRLNGTFPAPNLAYANATIDVYLADPVALANQTYYPKLMVHPMTWLGSFVDNGAGDGDPDAFEFSLDLAGTGAGQGNYLLVAVTYSQEAGAQNVGTSVTGPVSNPVARRPTLFTRVAAGQLELSWPAAEGTFILQANSALTPAGWVEVTGVTHVDGNNIIPVQTDGNRFFRLISQ